MTIGSIIAWGSDTLPTGWLLCDGSAVSRTTYADLFAVIGTNFGTGDGSTTFNLPDLRGRVGVGKSSDTEFDTLGETGGEKTHTLTTQEIPSHTHTAGLTGLNQVAQHTTQAGSYPANIIGDYAANWNATGLTINNTGGGQAHNILQPYVVTNYIIKALVEDKIKISELESASSIDGTEVMPIVQSGITKKITTDDLLSDIYDTIAASEQIETINLLEANGTAQIVKQKFYKQGKHIWGDALVKGETNFSGTYQYPCKLIYDYPNTAGSDLTCVLCYGEFTASGVGYMFINYNQKNIMISDTTGGNDKQYAKIHLDFVLN